MTDAMNNDRIGPALKVWWIPQVPMKPFEVLVNSLADAKLLLTVLADYDAFQFANHIKPDYSNAGGVVMLDEYDEWADWEGEEGRSIDDFTLEECAAMDRDYYDAQMRHHAKP